MRLTDAILAAFNALFVWYGAYRWWSGKEGLRLPGFAWMMMCFGGFLAQNSMGRVAAIRRDDPMTWQDPVWLVLNVLTTFGAMYIIARLNYMRERIDEYNRGSKADPRVDS